MPLRKIARRLIQTRSASHRPVIHSHGISAKTLWWKGQGVLQTGSRCSFREYSLFVSGPNVRPSVRPSSSNIPGLHPAADPLRAVGDPFLAIPVAEPRPVSSSSCSNPFRHQPRITRSSRVPGLAFPFGLWLRYRNRFYSSKRLGHAVDR